MSALNISQSPIDCRLKYGSKMKKNRFFCFVLFSGFGESKGKMIKGTPFNVTLTPPQLDSTHLDLVETINVSINTA